MKYVIPALLFTVGLCGRAWADEVRLVNGNKLSGIARVAGDRVIIELKIGTVTVPRAEVAEIVVGRCVLHEYQERLDRLGRSPAAPPLFELAQWAQREGITRHVAPLLERVIALETDHPGARAMLGYERFEGRWLTKIGVLKAKGFVEFRGKWVMPAEREATLAREEAERAKRRETASKPARTEREPVFYLGLPPYPRPGARSGGGGSWYLYGYYGPLYGVRRGSWGYHWGGSHTGSYGGRP